MTAMRLSSRSDSFVMTFADRLILNGAWSVSGLESGALIRVIRIGCEAYLAPGSPESGSFSIYKRRC